MPPLETQPSLQQPSSHTSAFKPVSWWERFLRHRSKKLFARFPAHLALTVEDADGIIELGDPKKASFAAKMIIHDPATYPLLAWNGSLGACEAYLQGMWTTPDLVRTLRLFSQMFDTVNTLDRGTAWLNTLKAKLHNFRRHNSRIGSERNIAEHYDLSNEFFALFLDPTMMYSSACYDGPDMSLEEASRNKLKMICRKLQLEGSDHLLEIGTGWGGMAQYAAEQFGCQVTTTTISKKQFAYASKLFARTSLDSRITLLQKDYRDLTGEYDKIVSIEMIEAVGRRYLLDYFRQCDRLLKQGGRFVVQAIVIPEQRFEIYKRSVDFIQTYIFPGSFLPSIASMQEAVGQGTRLRLVGLQDYTPSYVLTLREWRRRFLSQLDAVRQLGFDERFIRMWNFYLASCEAVFHERAAGLVQLEWIKT
jgi:cyclopropane-fatty-acyl-phospholipid synthase